MLVRLLEGVTCVGVGGLSLFIGPGSFADFGGRGGDASRTYVGDETATGDGGDQQVPRRAAAYGVSTVATASAIVRSRVPGGVYRG